MVMCLRRYCHGAARDGLFRFGCLLPASTGTSFGCRRGLGVGLTVDMPVAVVAHHIVYDGGDLLLELVDEPGGIVFMVFDVAELLFPDTRELHAGEELLVDGVDELYACRCGHDVLTLTAYVVAFKECLDDAGT